MYEETSSQKDSVKIAELSFIGFTNIENDRIILDYRVAQNLFLYIYKRTSCHTRTAQMFLRLLHRANSYTIIWMQINRYIVPSDCQQSICRPRRQFTEDRRRSTQSFRFRHTTFVLPDVQISSVFVCIHWESWAKGCAAMYRRQSHGLHPGQVQWVTSHVSLNFTNLHLSLSWIRAFSQICANCNLYAMIIGGQPNCRILVHGSFSASLHVPKTAVAFSSEYEPDCSAWRVDESPG